MVYLYLLGCVGSIVLQGFFAASEISFISSSTLKLRHRQNKGDRQAKKVYELLLNPEKFLATTLVGTNLSVVLSSSLLTFFLISLGVKNSNVWITFAFTPFVVVFAELIPKNIGRMFKEVFSCKVVGIFSFFEKLFSPIVESIETVSARFIRIFVKAKKHRSLFVTKEEIRLLVKEAEKSGSIDKGEKEAIEEVFGFRSDKIKDVCIGIKKVVYLDRSDSRDTALEKARKYRLTRYPVFSSFPPKAKDILGYVNIYDLFYNSDDDWHTFIRPITKVGFNQNLQQVFTLLQEKKESIAVVFKGKKIHGIITVHDLIREIITSIIKI
jgi:putative hemolysin